MNRVRNAFVLAAIVTFAAGIKVRAVADGSEATPFDLLHRAYAPYMSEDDPFAFPMKVRSLATDPYKFWRGSKDLFFIWCKSNTTDWLADEKAFLPNHGDLHLGNIGTYPAEGGWNRLAFGMVDFDDSARLPFQLELLQGLITLQLTARQNSIPLDESASNRLIKTMLDAYRIAVNSRRNATDLLIDGGDTLIPKMLEQRKIPYGEELKTFTENGKFRSVILSEKGKPKDILRPAMNRADEFASGLAQAMANEPDMQPLLRFKNAKEIRTAIKDVAQRTRLASSGSQGLRKYFVLLDKPLRGIDHDVVIYLKQEIPSAAERSDVIPTDSRSPGKRAKEDMDHLTEPRPYLNSWCDIGGESYWVSFKEPWSEELDPEDVKTSDDLLHMARVWGTVAGATHREEGRFGTILPRLTPELTTKLQRESNAFLIKLDECFASFKADPRTTVLRQRADEALARFTH